ncbi:ParA family protein [Kytococcus sp. Marseille-QA3725]
MTHPVGWPTGTHPAIPTAPTPGSSPVGWQPPVGGSSVERVPAVGTAEATAEPGGEDVATSASTTETGDSDDEEDDQVPPFSPAERKQRGRPEPLTAPSRMVVVTVANQKGGVGKTTTTVNVAAALAEGGLDVLVIDLDPQGNASTALSIEHQAGTAGVYDVLIDEATLPEVAQTSPENERIQVVPATIDLAGAEIELVSLVARETRLRRALQDIRGTGRYDVVLIDCPPSLGLLTVNGFVAADEVFIPIQCEYYALEGVSMLVRNISLIQRHLHPELQLGGILLTMFDARTRLATQVAQEVRDHFGDVVLETLIPRSVRISEAPSYGQTVLAYDGDGPGARAYRSAAKELVDRWKTLPSR